MNKKVQDAAQKWFENGEALVHTIAEEHARRGLLLVRKECHLHDFMGTGVGNVQFHTYKMPKRNITLIVRPNYTGYTSLDTFLEEWKAKVDYEVQFRKRGIKEWTKRKQWLSMYREGLSKEKIQEEKDDCLASFRRQNYNPPRTRPESPLKIMGEHVADIKIPRLRWNFDSDQKQGYFMEQCPSESPLEITEDMEYRIRKQRIVAFDHYIFDEYFLVGEIENKESLEKRLNNPRNLKDDTALFAILKQYEGEEKQIRVPHYG